MSLFIDRSRRTDTHLEWKVRLFSVAAVAGLLGIYFDERWMGLLAIALLAIAMGLGVMGRGAERAEMAEEDAEEDEEGDGGLEAP